MLRNRLISAIDSLPASNHPERKKFLLYLPENELHELGLLFYAYLIRSAGHETLYLGQSTPFHSLTEACEKWQPDYLVTGALSQLSVPEPESYLSQLSSTFINLKILVSGLLTIGEITTGFPNVFPVRTVPDLKWHL
jgi:methanogenic corrinoid protein MtbC1